MVVLQTQNLLAAVSKLCVVEHDFVIVYLDCEVTGRCFSVITCGPSYHLVVKFTSLPGLKVYKVFK